MLGILIESAPKIYIQVSQEESSVFGRAQYRAFQQNVSYSGFRYRTMDFIARIKKRQDALKRTTRHVVLTRVQSALILTVEF
jgi:hypothetical protein